MSKKSCFRGPIDRQHGKRVIILLKSAPQHVYHIYWSLLREFCWKKSLFVVCPILRLFPNILAANDKYPVLNGDKLMIAIQMQLYQKQKTFANFFSEFLKCGLGVEHNGKKDGLHRTCISGITNSKNVVWQMSKKSCFRGLFHKQHSKEGKILLKFAWQHLYHIYWSLSSQLSCKNCLLMTWQMLRLFPNLLAANDKWPVLNSDKLTIPIQMQLSQKQKTFSEFFAAFLKSKLNSAHFGTRDDRHRFCISEMTDSKNVVRWICKKFCFRGSFDKQHGKSARTLLKSA